jgi:hypothetical protein
VLSTCVHLAVIVHRTLYSTLIIRGWCSASIQRGSLSTHSCCCCIVFIIIIINNFRSCDSSVGVALGYGLDDRGSRVRFPAELGIFLFTTVSRPALGLTQPPIQWVPGALSLGVKRPGREAEHSPPSSAEVKNAWSYANCPYPEPASSLLPSSSSLSSLLFAAWCLITEEHVYI